MRLNPCVRFAIRPLHIPRIFRYDDLDRPRDKSWETVCGTISCKMGFQTKHTLGGERSRITTPRALCRPTCRYTPRTRLILSGFLVILSLPSLSYHFSQSFRAATDATVSSILSRLHSQMSSSDMCTKQIGSGHCCSIYMDAMPCVDECSKRHVDRETLRLTLEYDECAEVCLVSYEGLCGLGGEESGIEKGI